MTPSSRLSSDQVDTDRTMQFSLSVLRAGPVLPLKPMRGAPDPVAVPDDGAWPWPLLDDCRRRFGVEVQPVPYPRETILLSLNQVFDMASASAEQMIEELDADDALSRDLAEVGDLLDSEDSAPIIRLVNTLISQALKERASDIHIEPFEARLVVRFRVDGVLHAIVNPPKGLQAALTSRIKVMAGMDIAEKRHPQDGRFRVRVAGREVDVRASVLPTAFGERVVMRLLDQDARLMMLPELGMDAGQLELLRRTIAAPHGMMLVTGPTGSGKSTTLYAALMELDRGNRNVMTIEDPIEYQLDGVAQMQVRPKIGVGFATGLRSILRQDPDIVMVGEIRDLETAEIAIQASLTGHLVLATLHTNDALSAIVRLQDMGVERYLVASSLILVQAQRLVRRLCPQCRSQRTPTAEDWRALDADPTQYAHVAGIHEAVGCDACFGSGFRGRVAIYEMTAISEAMRDLIHEGAGLPAMRRQAAVERMHSLRQDGARHVAAGITSVDEVLRVSREEAMVLPA